MSVKTAALYEPGYLVAGKYELESLLGQGGMGAVWRARNVALDAPVAIKVVRASGDKAQLRSRLMQEARAAAKLTHAAIVKVFDVGQTEAGDPFIVMELLHGDSLGKLLETQGRFSATQAVRLLLPICDALWLAHGKGIIHRDLKPDNVFVVQHEGSIQPTLVDFGIVKIQESENERSLTKDGDVLGSPDYMSPEQARGQDDMNHLTDVWSFSVVLYEAIAGHTPFKGANYNALLRQIVEDTPRSLQELAAGDAELSAIVMRGLSKNPAQRFESMGELGRALASWLISHGVTEDICGTTLETKWLRGTDVVSRGRPKLQSVTDEWPSSEKGSGVRRNAAGVGSTIPAGDQSANRRPNRLLLAAFAFAALCLGAGITFAVARGHSPPPVASSQQGLLKPEAAALAPAQALNSAPADVVPAASAPTASADEGAAQPPAEAVSLPSDRAPVAASHGRKPAAPARPMRAPRPGKAKTKSGDLMSPY